MAIGNLLRGLGSVLNPQVAQELAAEDKQQLGVANQVGLLGLQQRMQQQSPEYQAKLEALKNEKLFRDEVSGAGGDMTKIAGAAVKYGKPELAVSLYNQQEARAARLQQSSEALETRRLQLQQNHELALQRITDSQQRAEETKRHNLALEGLNAQNATLNAEIKRQGLLLQGIGVQLQRDTLELKKIQATEGGKPPSGYRWKEGEPGVLEPIPGGPATVLSPEQAAKTELLQNGIKDVERFRELVFKDGKPDRALLAAMMAPGGGIPGTDSRLAYSYIYNAVEAKLRAESGAAVPEAEVTRMAKRFVPSALDNDKTIESKVDRLGEFLGGSLGRVKGQPGAGTQGRDAPKPKDDPLGIR